MPFRQAPIGLRRAGALFAASLPTCSPGESESSRDAILILDALLTHLQSEGVAVRAVSGLQCGSLDMCPGLEQANPRADAAIARLAADRQIPIGFPRSGEDFPLCGEGVVRDPPPDGGFLLSLHIESVAADTAAVVVERTCQESRGGSVFLETDGFRLKHEHGQWRVSRVIPRSIS
jgi:hypothetical protein